MNYRYVGGALMIVLALVSAGCGGASGQEEIVLLTPMMLR
jgi:hypothetical protein